MAAPCDTGTVIGGGVSWGGYVPNVFLEGNRPDPESGTPNSWFIDVANASDNSITVSSDVVCAGPAGSSANAAAQANAARGLKKVLTPLH